MGWRNKKLSKQSELSKQKVKQTRQVIPQQQNDVPFVGYLETVKDEHDSVLVDVDDGLLVFDDARLYRNSNNHEGKRPPQCPEMDCLCDEIDTFVARATSSQEDEDGVELAVSQVRNVVQSTWPEANVVIFGSRATGLALPGGDLDIGILNISKDLQNAGSGYKGREKKQVSSLLNQIISKLKKAKVISKPKLIRARIPIIKCEISLLKLPCDISIGVSNGERALHLIKKFLKDFPNFRPLVFVIKAMLKTYGLDEVFTGGLGSYSLYNMIIAHLMTERRESFTVKSTGESLLSFFKRFGHAFNYVSDAVSINQGGIISKQRAWVQKAKPFSLAVEDPQEDGRDIGAVSHNIKNISNTFEVCHGLLMAELKNVNQSNGGQKGASKKLSLLETIIDVDNVLSKIPRPINIRKAAPRQKQPGELETSHYPKHKRRMMAGKHPSREQADNQSTHFTSLGFSHKGGNRKKNFRPRDEVPRKNKKTRFRPDDIPQRLEGQKKKKNIRPKNSPKRKYSNKRQIGVRGGGVVKKQRGVRRW